MKPESEDQFVSTLTPDELYAYTERLGILSQGAAPTESEKQIARDQILEAKIK